MNHSSFTLAAKRASGLMTAAALCFCLAACGLLPDKDPEDMPENWPEEKLYFAGKDRLESGSCNGAIDY